MSISTSLSSTPPPPSSSSSFSAPLSSSSSSSSYSSTSSPIRGRLTPYKMGLSKKQIGVLDAIRDSVWIIRPRQQHIVEHRLSESTFIILGRLLPVLSPKFRAISSRLVDEFEKTGKSVESGLCITGGLATSILMSEFTETEPGSAALLHTELPHTSLPRWYASDIDLSATVDMRENYEASLNCLCNSMAPSLLEALRNDNLDLLDLILAYMAFQPLLQHNLERCYEDIKIILIETLKNLLSLFHRKSANSFTANKMLDYLSKSSLNHTHLKLCLADLSKMCMNLSSLHKAIKNIALTLSNFKSEEHFLQEFIKKYYLEYQLIDDRQFRQVSDRGPNEILSLMVKFGPYNVRLDNVDKPQAIVSTGLFDGPRIGLIGVNRGKVWVVNKNIPCQEAEAKAALEIMRSANYSPDPTGLDDMSFRVLLNITRGAVIPSRRDLTIKTLAQLLSTYGCSSPKFIGKISKFIMNHSNTAILSASQRPAFTSLYTDENGAPLSWRRACTAAFVINSIFYLQHIEDEKLRDSFIQSIVKNRLGIGFTSPDLTTRYSSSIISAVHGQLICASLKTAAVAHRAFPNSKRHQSIWGDWSLSLLVDKRPFYIAVEEEPLGRSAVRHLQSFNHMLPHVLSSETAPFLSPFGLSPYSRESSVQTWLEIMRSPPELLPELSSFSNVLVYQSNADFYRIVYEKFQDCLKDEVQVREVRDQWLKSGLLALAESSTDSFWKGLSICLHLSDRAISHDLLKAVIEDINEERLEKVFSTNPQLRILVIERLLNFIYEAARTKNRIRCYGLISIASRCGALFPPDIQFFAQIICYQSSLNSSKLQEHIKLFYFNLRQGNWKSIQKSRKSVSEDLREAIGALMCPPLNAENVKHACESLSLIIDSPDFIALQDVILQAINKLLPSYQKEWETLRAKLLKHESEPSSSRSMTHGSTVILRQMVLEPPFAQRSVKQVIESIRALDYANGGIHLFVHSFPLLPVHEGVLDQFKRLIDLNRGNLKVLFTEEFISVIRQLFENRQWLEMIHEKANRQFFALAESILFSEHHSLAVSMFKSLCERSPKLQSSIESRLLRDLSSKTDSSRFIERLNALSYWSSDFEPIIKHLMTMFPSTPEIQMPPQAIACVNTVRDERTNLYNVKHKFFDSLTAWIKAADSPLKGSVNKLLQEGRVFLEHLKEKTNKIHSSNLISILDRLKTLLSRTKGDDKLVFEEFDRIGKALLVILQTATVETLVATESLIEEVFLSGVVTKENRDPIYLSIISRYEELESELPISLLKWDVGHQKASLSSSSTSTKGVAFRNLCARLKSCSSRDSVELDFLVVNTVDDLMKILAEADKNPVTVGQIQDLVLLLKDLFNRWGSSEEVSKGFEELITKISSSSLLPTLRVPPYCTVFDGILRTNNEALITLALVNLYQDPPDLLDVRNALEILAHIAEHPRELYYGQFCNIVKELSERDQASYLKAVQLKMKYCTRLFFSERVQDKKETYIKYIYEICNDAMPKLARLTPDQQEICCRELIDALVPTDRLELLPIAINIVIDWRKNRVSVLFEHLLIKVKLLESEKLIKLEIKKLVPYLSLAAESQDVTNVLEIIEMINKLPYSLENWSFCIELLLTLSSRIFVLHDASKDHLRKKIKINLVVKLFQDKFDQYLITLLPLFMGDPYHKSNAISMLEQMLSIYNAVGKPGFGLQKLFESSHVYRQRQPGYLGYQICSKLFQYKFLESTNEEENKNRMEIQKTILSEMDRLVQGIIVFEKAHHCEAPLSFMKFTECDFDKYTIALKEMHRGFFTVALRGELLEHSRRHHIPMKSYELFTSYLMRVLNSNNFYKESHSLVISCFGNLILRVGIIKGIKKISECSLEEHKMKKADWFKYFLRAREHEAAIKAIIEFAAAELEDTCYKNTNAHTERAKALKDKEYFEQCVELDSELDSSDNAIMRATTSIVQDLTEEDVKVLVGEEVQKKGTEAALQFLEQSLKEGHHFHLKSLITDQDKMESFRKTIDLFQIVKKNCFCAISDYRVLEFHMFWLERIVKKWYEENKEDLLKLRNDMMGAEMGDFADFFDMFPNVEPAWRTKYKIADG